MHEIIFQAIDLETNGLNAKADEILEIAVITFRRNEILDIYHQFYSAEAYNPTALAVNQLTPEQLFGWPEFSAAENVKFLSNFIKYPIIAHNAPFERRFLVANNVIGQDHFFIDTLSKCRNNPTKLANNQLRTWLDYLKVPHRPHGALSDCFGLIRMCHIMGFDLEYDYKSSYIT